MATSKRRKKPAKHVIRARRREERDDDDVAAGTWAARWWKADSEEACQAALWLWIDRLRQRWAADNLVDLIHEAIYQGRPLGTGVEYPALQHLRQRRSSPANLNITRSMVDTATARLTKRRPMPVIGADDAGWTEKLFAKRTSRILRRKMGGPKVERISPDIIRAMIIRGTAVAKVVRVGGDVDIDHVPIYEIVADPREARYGAVRTLAHVRPVAREVLIESFPGCAEYLREASAYERTDPWTMYAYDGPTFADHLEVAEAWHLPSGPNAEDGEHVITVRGHVLLREPWKRPRFPLAFVHWSNPVRGFRGQGLVEDLTGIQAKVNDVARDIQECLYFGSSLKVFVNRAANVNKHHLRARHPVVVEYDGVEPHYSAPNPVSQQAIQFLELLIQKAYEISGISQMSASSKNILGSNASGKAIDTLDDIQSDRFAHVESGYMRFRCDLGQCVIDEARAMYEEAHASPEDADDVAESIERLTPEDLAPWIEEHDWGKVDVDGGTYHLAIEPINFLPDSRAGKLSAVAELSKAGLIPDPTMTADLFDEPDLARANRSILGPKHNLDRCMEQLADLDIEEIDCQPHPHMNLALGVLMAKGELNDAEASKAPEEVLERYRRWIANAKRLIDNAKKAEAEAAAGAAPSLPGMQATNMGPAPNAMGLQPDLAGAPMAPPPGGPMPPPMPGAELAAVA